MTAATLRRAVAAGVLVACGLGTSGCSGDPASDPERSTAAAAAAADALVQQGLDHLAAGDRESAAGAFEHVLTVDPANVFGHYNLGYLAQLEGEEEAALERYDAALDADDDFAPALFNKAILVEAADLDEAVGLYERAVAADDTMAAAHMRLGFALVQLGRTDEGEEHLGRGVALDPAMADVEAPVYE